MVFLFVEWLNCVTALYFFFFFGGGGGGVPLFCYKNAKNGNKM